MSLPKGPIQFEAVRGLLSEWEKNNGEELRTYILGIVDEEMRSQLAIELAYQLGRRNFKSSAEWVRFIEKRVKPDEIYLAALPNIVEDCQFAQTINKLQSIDNETVRKEAIVDCFSQWYFCNPAAATLWLKEAGLDAGLKNEMDKKEPKLTIPDRSDEA